MGAKNSNKDGKYPSWVGVKTLVYNTKTLKRQNELLYEILSNYSDTPGLEKVIRELTNKIYHLLERVENKYYYVSKGFIEGEPSIVEHMIPHGVEISIIREKIEKKEIKNKEDLLNFVRENYFVCLVSINENRLLEVNGFMKSMPVKWWEDETNREGIVMRKPFARYEGLIKIK